MLDLPLEDLQEPEVAGKTKNSDSNWPNQFCWITLLLFKQHVQIWWKPNSESVQEILVLQQEVSDATMGQVVP